MKEMIDIGQLHAGRTKCPSVISAVYFLFQNGKLQYIGQTLNLLSRIGEHREKSWFEWDSYAFIKTHPEDLYAHERLYIKKFDPSCNRTLRSSKNNASTRELASKKKLVQEVDIETLTEKMSRV